MQCGRTGRKAVAHSSAAQYSCCISIFVVNINLLIYQMCCLMWSCARLCYVVFSAWRCVLLWCSRRWRQCRHSGRGYISWPTVSTCIWNMSQNTSRFVPSTRLVLTKLVSCLWYLMMRIVVHCRRRSKTFSQTMTLMSCSRVGLWRRFFCCCRLVQWRDSWTTSLDDQPITAAEWLSATVWHEPGGRWESPPRPPGVSQSYILHCQSRIMTSGVYVLLRRHSAVE